MKIQCAIFSNQISDKRHIIDHIEKYCNSITKRLPIKNGQRILIDTTTKFIVDNKHAKMLTIVSYYGNADKNHNEILLNIQQGTKTERADHNMFARMSRNQW